MLKVELKSLDTVAILYVQGQIINGETEILRPVIAKLSGQRAVIMDLGRVNTIDAHGLGVMLELRAQAEAKGMRFELRNVNRLLHRVLSISRLDTVFKITPSVEIFPAGAGKRHAAGTTLRCA